MIQRLKNKKNIIAISILTIFLPIVINANELAQPQAVPVSVATVIDKEVIEWDEFPARLEAIEKVEIRSRVAGALEVIHFKDGQVIEKGQPIFTIEQYPYKLEVAKAEANMVAAKSQSNLSSNDFKRSEKLFQSKNISQHDYDKNKNTKSLADANLKKSEAEYATAKLNLNYTKILAPITGRINRSNLSIGNLIDISTALTSIVSINPIYASFDADEPSFVKYMQAHSDNMDKMMQIQVEMIIGDKHYKGSIKSFDNEINPLAGTVRVRAVFDNNVHNLVPGLFARVRLGGSGKVKAVLINERAILTDQSKKFVYVVGSDNKIAYREIVPGSSVEGLRVITSGLKPGENIVVNGLQRVRPEVVVAPKMVDMYNLIEETKRD